jgi:hypothetical protein
LAFCFVVVVLLLVETLVKILLYSPILFNFTMLLPSPNSRSGRQHIASFITGRRPADLQYI